MQVSWLDRAVYPFAHHTLEVDGGQMHYVDEGHGEPILFVHGSSVWSFLYRHVIRELSQEYRCIAPDHIGFGLSAKPAAWGYSFAAHMRNLATLIDHLGLQRVTLVVHDVGGPIGLGYAIEQPERIARLLIMNTFCWPLQGEFALAPGPIATLARGPLGRLSIMELNAELRVLVPLVYGDRSKLTPAIHRQYLAPLARPADRHGLFAVAQQVFSASSWCAALWERRAILANLPATILWGMRDPLFGQRFLARWCTTLPTAEVVTLPAAGHFVPEEDPAALVRALRRPVGASPR
ncbi:MAG TPA: alpha/beta fold hydrolase [Roseiflexaceae bacterium]|nr:alpha/beta fold hydrolase [Roseiflexaceae bacterium]